MNILVTGAKGFLGRNLCAELKNIRDGKERCHSALVIDEVMEYDIDTEPTLLEEYCAKAGFVFNLAGVNRPKEQCEFMKGNFDFASILLDTLKKHRNTCPVMLASSIQATLIGRYGESDYGKSKLAAEELFCRYGEETGARVLVYRFTNVFGKWCRPDYNSVIATYCHNFANSLPIKIYNPTEKIELTYIDDLVHEMVLALQGKEHRCEYDGLQPTFTETGRYCAVPVTHKATLSEIAHILEQFKDQPKTLLIPEMPNGSLAKKLYSTYVSYLPKDGIAFPLRTNADERGSFTELIRTVSGGQFSVNVSKPGITKGQHWHHSKWEFFIVVSGRALIKERQLYSDEVLEFEVSGDKMEVVHMLPGYIHSITNLSGTEPLVTIMWANETFNIQHPDTYSENI